MLGSAAVQSLEYSIYKMDYLGDGPKLKQDLFMMCMHLIHIPECNFVQHFKISFCMKKLHDVEYSFHGFMLELKNFWIFPATWKVELGGLKFKANPGKKSYRHPISKNQLSMVHAYNPHYTRSWDRIIAV
jgi:hypothetical protein